jgi:hypothetical protein
VRCKVVETEEPSAYCAVALAGLDDLPDTMRTRPIIVRMRRAPGEYVEPRRHRVNGPEAWPIAEKLANWSTSSANLSNWPEMPDGIEGRNADVWEPLLAVADLAGGDRPARARVAAVTLVADLAGGKQTLGVQLLADLRGVFGDEPAMHTETILVKSNALEDGPWGDLRGKPLDARGLASRLRKYASHLTMCALGDKVLKGYKAEDLTCATLNGGPDAAHRVNGSDRFTSLPPGLEEVAERRRN